MTGQGAKRYIEKNGRVYGTSSVYTFGEWKHTVFCFNNFSRAEEWLYAEAGRFSIRKLCSKTEAIRLVGKRRIREIEESGFYDDEN